MLFLEINTVEGLLVAVIDGLKSEQKRRWVSKQLLLLIYCIKINETVDIIVIIMKCKFNFILFVMFCMVIITKFKFNLVY